VTVYEAALWALIAICLVMVGAILTPGLVQAEQKAPILAGIATILFAIGWRVHRTVKKEDDE
jgi:hypothetical protein